MTKHFSDQSDQELWSEAEMGREALSGLALMYFGFHVAMLWLFHYELMLFMLVLFNALVAGLIYMAVLQGNNRARLLIGFWAALPGALVLLYIIWGLAGDHGRADFSERHGLHGVRRGFGILLQQVDTDLSTVQAARAGEAEGR